MESAGRHPFFLSRFTTQSVPFRDSIWRFVELCCLGSLTFRGRAVGRWRCPNLPITRLFRPATVGAHFTALGRQLPASETSRGLPLRISRLRNRLPWARNQFAIDDRRRTEFQNRHHYLDAASSSLRGAARRQRTDEGVTAAWSIETAGFPALVTRRLNSGGP